MLHFLNAYNHLACKGTTKNAHVQTKLLKVHFRSDFACTWAALSC